MEVAELCRHAGGGEGSLLHYVQKGQDRVKFHPNIQYTDCSGHMTELANQKAVNSSISTGGPSGGVFSPAGKSSSPWKLTNFL